ncbi:hypothetical protein H920_06841 [Fukomys damarensis]|uniref:Uncharacterized protein n=1 Tax=Fukomys damarensis TaxID=885580 RepID=A0A091DNG1_FUKDA|nr:hypothetical protein H920_06841 [Fukomys damarensis]
MWVDIKLPLLLEETLAAFHQQAADCRANKGASFWGTLKVADKEEAENPLFGACFDPKYEPQPQQLKGEKIRKDQAQKFTPIRKVNFDRTEAKDEEQLELVYAGGWSSEQQMCKKAAWCSLIKGAPRSTSGWQSQAIEQVNIRTAPRNSEIGAARKVRPDLDKASSVGINRARSTLPDHTTPPAIHALRERCSFLHAKNALDGSI